MRTASSTVSLPSALKKILEFWMFPSNKLNPSNPSIIASPNISLPLTSVRTISTIFGFLLILMKTEIASFPNASTLVLPSIISVSAETRNVFSTGTTIAANPPILLSLTIPVGSMFPSIS